MTTMTGYVVHKKLSTNARIEINQGIRLRDSHKIILKFPSNGYHASAFTQLQHECYLLKQLQLPSIIRAEEIIQIGNTPVLVLEYADGLILKKYLSNQPLDLNQFFNMAIQLVDIINELHKRHIIHKGLNPNIILVEQNLNLKLLSLSSATELSEETQDFSNLNLMGESLAYISPEQTGRMNRPVDYRTDFYSLGIILFEMLTGQVPFQTEDILELVHSHIAKPAMNVTKFNSDIPPTLAAIIAKLLEKMPEERYASIVGLRADLIKCAESWQQYGKIDNFQLGQKDLHSHLHISHQLYGRSSQVRQLLDTFEKVSQGITQLELIAGYSGIGKTSLVREVHKPIVRRKGYFIQGKFDQLQRGMPYSAIVTAFQGLIKQVLAEQEKRHEKLKQELITALGDSAQVIIDMIPNVELMIGPQPSVPKLDLAETQRRFILVFQKFVHVFSQINHPLVIFLDDLQWADTASLKLIENILTDPNTHYLMILGAYRDNEVDSSHPLMKSIQHLQRANVLIETLTLQPLKSDDAEQLVMDSLTCTRAKALPLATCIYEKTQGNPFFINEFIKIIHQQKLLTFSYDSKQWQWDLYKIKQQSMMDNVINLLNKKISLLSKPTQELLKLASCIGHYFTLQTLSIISEQDYSQTAKQIWEAIQLNLILPLEEANKTAALTEIQSLIKHKQEKLSYQFAHDRIQQATYQLIDDNIKQKTQLNIGRLLLKEQALQEQSEQLFEVMDHFNKSLSLITNTEEKITLATYNLWAGKKAKQSTAYQAALNYLQAGITLIQPINWQENYELAFSLLKEMSSCKYLTGEFKKADEDFKQLLEYGRTVLDKISIYQINIQMLSTQNKHTEAIQMGRKALRLLNIHLPKKANTLHVLLTIFKIKMQMKWQSTKKINLLPMKKPEHQAAIDLITQLLNNAFISDQTLFVLLASMDVKLSLEYGYTESTSMAILVYAFALMHALNWFSEGFEFVDLYTRLKQQYSEANFAGRNSLVLGTFIDPWRFPYDECLETLLNGHLIAFDVGDIVYSNYCNVVGTITAFLMGKPLPEIKNIINNSLLFIARSNINDFKLVTHFWKHAITLLEDNAKFELNELTVKEKEILKSENKTGISFFYSMFTKVCYILGYFSEAKQSAIKQRKYSEFALGILSNLENEFYYALSITATYPEKPLTNNQWHILNKIHSYIKRCANRYPPNFQFYILLLDAEMNRIKNNTEKVIYLYEQAITSAKKLNALHLVAIADECAGRFYINLKVPQFAKLYFLDAYSAYKSWGARAKCEKFELLYPDWFANYSSIENPIFLSTPTSTTSANTQTLDMLAVYKLNQAISSEIDLDKLLEKLLSIVLEAAGAQRGVFLLLQNNQWVVEAEGNMDQQQINLLHPQIAKKRQDLPLSLLNYVQRTQEPVIIQEALHAELTLTDSYIQREKPQSLLMMPLLYQGQLRRILYLENKSSSQVFTTQHLQNLQLLASQAVVSLENAYLYYQASHDPLTGLANRGLLYQKFQDYADSVLKEKKQIAILFLDIDYFKNVNDTLGHDLGDQLLIYLAEKFKKTLRSEDILVRLGGDEFVIMLTRIRDQAEAMIVVNRIYQYLGTSVNLMGHEFWISTSMGISFFPSDAMTISNLLKRADIALYRAKETGRNQYRFYSIELEEQHQQAHITERELQRAFKRQEFYLYYQPIFHSQTNQITSLEVLLRWQHPEKGLLQTSVFIEFLEKSLLMDSIGIWVLRTACQQAKRWQQQGLLTGPIAVNISISQFKKQSLSKLIANILQETQLPSKFLELELTETTFIENNEQVLKEIFELKKIGVQLVLDDFGTGYSNLTYLKRLPINKIKIDRTFVQDSQHGLQSRAIISAIIAMAYSLNLEVIAEGIETEAQLNYLRNQKVHGIQGYYLSYPLTADECEQLLLRMADNPENNTDQH